MQLRFIIIGLYCFLLQQYLNAQAVNNEELNIKATIENYIQGRNNGDSVRLKKAFHLDAVLKSVDPNGQLVVWPAQDYIKRMSTGKKQDCTSEIIEVKQFGNAAQATVIIKYPLYTYYDYLNMLKVQGQWLITDKIFARQPADKKVLIVVSSHSQLGQGKGKAGVFLKEVSHVYKALYEAGFDIDFVSPNGGIEH
ncbi:MAG TPA: nuclear transport factor 2 family protein, partial [Flavisolibacter sp.]|nr:nuclear transport factor 2 family protein [Flavisolibacter sp.]